MEAPVSACRKPLTRRSFHHMQLCCAVPSLSVESDSLWPGGLQPARLPLSMGVLQARILEWVAMPSSRDFPNPGTEPTSLMSPALVGGFLTTNATWEAQHFLQPLLIKIPSLVPFSPAHSHVPYYFQGNFVNDTLVPNSASPFPEPQTHSLIVY